MRPRLGHTGLAFTALLALAAGSHTVLAQSMNDVQKAAAERGLTTSDLLAAAKTFTPSGMLDEYVIFSSGGHSGQVFAIGVPSMRLLRTIAVFTPEPWQGWGYGAGNEVLAGGEVDGHLLDAFRRFDHRGSGRGGRFVKRIKHGFFNAGGVRSVASTDNSCALGGGSLRGLRFVVQFQHAFDGFVIGED